MVSAKRANLLKQLGMLCVNCCLDFDSENQDSKILSLPRSANLTTSEDGILIVDAISNIFSITLEDLLIINLVNDEEFEKPNTVAEFAGTIGMCSKCAATFQEFYDSFTKLRGLADDDSLLWKAIRRKRGEVKVKLEVNQESDFDNAQNNENDEYFGNSEEVCFDNIKIKSYSDQDDNNTCDEETYSNDENEDEVSSNNFAEDDDNSGKELLKEDAIGNDYVASNLYKTSAGCTTGSTNQRLQSRVERPKQVSAEETLDFCEGGGNLQSKTLQLVPTPHSQVIKCSKYGITPNNTMTVRNVKVGVGASKDENNEYPEIPLGKPEIPRDPLVYQRSPDERKGHIFKCSFCSKTFESSTILPEYQSCGISCHLCKKSFNGIEELKSHLLSHKGETLDVDVCPNCKMCFRNNEHAANHVCQRRIMYRCSTCTESFQKKRKVPVKHTHRSYNFVKCLQCGKKFRNSTLLTKHMETHTGGPFICALCGMKLKNKIILKRHEARHTHRDVYPCKMCGKNLSSARSLESHLLTHSEEPREKPFMCETCGSSFSTSGMLKGHTLVHTKEKPFDCKHCDMKFKTAYVLKCHGRTHTGEKPFECTFCQEKYSTSKTLKKHLGTHTGELPPHACNFCDKRFHLPSQLKKHETIHTGEKPHECGTCGKSFRLKKVLINHTRIHTGERPFECKVCNKTFSFETALRNHKRLLKHN